MTVAVTLGALTPADARPLARLHRAAFPGFFLSSLGEPFLVQFYRGFLMDDSAVCVVARADDGAVLGAVVGTTEPAGFFGRLVLNRLPGFVLASVRAVLTNPKAAPRLLRAARYRGGDRVGAGGALLSSICVRPSARGSGLGRQLMEAWTREVVGRGVDTAFLTTDADHNEAVNRFYQERGWTLADSCRTREGRLMNRYTTRLDAR